MDNPGPGAHKPEAKDNSMLTKVVFAKANRNLNENKSRGEGSQGPTMMS